jgi:flagellar hook capping protein FlgD
MSRFHLKRSVILCFLLAFPGAVFAATPFVNETADAPAAVSGNVTSMALDASGNPHIAYFDGLAFDLKYARKIGMSWVTETVDAAASAGQFCSISLDAQGNPNIAYYDVGNQDLKYARKNGNSWTLETVDATGNVGQYCSIGMDPQGNPRISYFDATNGDLKYARKSGSWTVETVDATGTTGLYTSLALDPQGNPHIAYYDALLADLKYASKTTAAWQIESVDVTGNVGTWASLALDAAAMPRIAYNDVTNNSIKLASRSGGWSTEVANAIPGTSVSLALDATGNPRISYTQASLGFLSKTLGGSWVAELVEPVATSPISNVASCVALDREGNPRISYIDNGAGDLKYADSAVHLLNPVGGERWAAGSTQTIRWTGNGAISILFSADGGLTYTTLIPSATGNAATLTLPVVTTESARIRLSRASPASTSDSPGFFAIAPDLVSPWWTKTVDATGSVGSYSSIALDAKDNPCISYRDVTNNDLKFARRAGSTWVTETVDNASVVGEYTSLALDSQGNPRISYYDGITGDLKYASKTNGIWALEVVTATGDVGYFTSLALDAQGNPSISYYDFTTTDVKFASKLNGVWTLETIDSAGDVGYYTSLALDAQGNPHVAYRDVTNSDQKYATKIAGVWTPETVDTDQVGGTDGIALDSQGNPRISYYQLGNQDLRFASKLNGVWTVETVDATGDVGAYSSLALDAKGDPGISYRDATNGNLKYACKTGGVWVTETVDAPGDVGLFTSLKRDTQGNPHISYWDVTNSDLRYASAAIELGDPSPGVTWPVGANRTVTWDGTGRVNLYLSSDGGNSWQLQASDLTGGQYRMLVPHRPSKFTQLKLERAVPRSSSATAGLFTIETDIALLNLKAQPGGGGVLLSWNTNPGPQDLGGYRVEKRWHNDDWQSVTAFTRETSITDPNGMPGTEYRLFGINGLGQELLLGSTTFGRLTPLQAGPLPFRGGNMQISFASDGGSFETEVALFDLQGRKVRSLAGGRYPVGVQTVTWDGRTDGGQQVASGAYFLRLSDGGRTVALHKIIVAR